MAFPPHHSGLPKGWAPPQLAPGGTYPWEGGPVASSTAAAAAVAAAAAAASVASPGGVAGSHQVPLRPMTTSSGHVTGVPRPFHQQTVGAKRGAAGAAGDAALESKRLKRLEKNRESARECRRRKKEHKEKLEEQLAVLDEENLDLRLRLKVGDEAKDAEHAEILQIKARLDDEVSRGAEESQILQTMDLLKERFADYGSVHVSATEFHLDQLSRLLQPTLTTRACLHAVLQTVVGTSDQATKQTGRKSNSEGSVSHSDAPGSRREGEEVARREQAPEIRREQQSVDTKRGAAEGSGKAVNGDTSGAIEEGLEGLPAGSSDVDGAGLGARTQPQLQGKKWEGVEGGKTVRQTPHTEGAEAEGDAAGIGFGVAREGARDEVWVDMWSCLVDVLEASEGQQAEMRSQAGAISELAADLESTTGILNRLKLLLADRNQTLDGEMAEIQRILTPTQTAKFVLWVSRNEACVHMLNQLWDKLHGDRSRDP